jgi:hypothetical protein
VIDARDGFLNLVQAWMQHSLLISKDSNGKYVREVMQKIGVDVPQDIENETLANEFLNMKKVNEELISKCKTLEKEINIHRAISHKKRVKSSKKPTQSSNM